MIHIIFSSSAAGTLRQLLYARGRRERIVDLHEYLDWGPIATDKFDDRVTWLDRHLPNDLGWDWISESTVKFHERAAADSDRLIWIAPCSAAEQAGLYWYLDQFGGARAQMIIADNALRGAWRAQPPLTLGELQQEAMAELYDEYPRLPWDSSRFPPDRWRTLVADNALLRIVDEGVLRSAPKDYFDHFLLERCSTEWVKWHRVVADAMADIWGTGRSADEGFLLWRLRELIQRGDVICSGELPRHHARRISPVMVRRAP